MTDRYAQLEPLGPRFPNEYVVYVHHTDGEAEAAAAVRAEFPEATITNLELLKPGKWAVCIRVPAAPAS